VRHLTLLTPTQNQVETLPRIDRTMKILIAGRRLGKATVVIGDEAYFALGALTEEAGH
jgi:hypothetical protein